MDVPTILALAAVAQCGGPDLAQQALVVYDQATLDSFELMEIEAAVEAAGFAVAGTHEAHAYQWCPPEPGQGYGPLEGAALPDDGIYDELPFVAAATGADVVIFFLDRGNCSCTMVFATVPCDGQAYKVWEYWSTAIAILNVAEHCVGGDLTSSDVPAYGFYFMNTPHDVANFNEQLCPGDHDGDHAVGTSDLLVAVDSGHVEPLLATLAQWGLNCLED